MRAIETAQSESKGRKMLKVKKFRDSSVGRANDC